MAREMKRDEAVELLYEYTKTDQLRGTAARSRR